MAEAGVRFLTCNKKARLKDLSLAIVLSRIRLLSKSGADLGIINFITFIRDRYRDIAPGHSMITGTIRSPKTRFSFDKIYCSYASSLKVWALGAVSLHSQ
jgi:hypothetical protein